VAKFLVTSIIQPFCGNRTVLTRLTARYFPAAVA